MELSFLKDYVADRRLKGGSLKILWHVDMIGWQHLTMLSCIQHDENDWHEMQCFRFSLSFELGDYYMEYPPHIETRCVNAMSLFCFLYPFSSVLATTFPTNMSLVLPTLLF